MSTPEFKQLHSLEEFTDLEYMALEIWEEHYTPIIGAEQVSYMMNKFQRAEIMFRQATEDNYQYYFVVLEGKRVGYLTYRIDQQELFLSKFYLQHEARGRGLARFMLRFLEDKARESGLSSIGLTVNKFNKASIGAYESMGFQIIEPLVIDIGGGYVMDDYRMKKTLS